ncbi:MAG: RNA 3'-terminal phosphate cyclase [Anaerolineales bacterium]|nr:RNA 3'-terminal phosphate cyclase [Anaerolineales bacterium]
MIEIDGSSGEGGGQLLRSALTLSTLTGKAFSMFNIRAGRPKPGLRPQHVRAVAAAAAISRAEVEGAAPGSCQLIFAPGSIRSGRYRFDIGSAGSVALVLQTIFLPLSLAGSASSVIITGGTHIPMAPCFEFLDLHWMAMMRRLGYSATLKIDRAGFYPEGGGKIEATIRPAGNPAPISLTHKPALKFIQGISAVANLDLQIAARQKRATFFHLQSVAPSLRIKTTELHSPGKGTALVLLAHYPLKDGSDASLGCFTSLGEKGKPAEAVAAQACQEILEFIHSPGAIDPYLADQLLLPLAIIPGRSELLTSRLTPHAISNIHVIQAFLPVEAQIDGQAGSPGRIHLTGIEIA